MMINSMWASISSWFTPIILFCFLNLMIGTIFIFSNFKIQNRSKQQLHEDNSPQFDRVPFLHRVKSINFSLRKFDQPGSFYPDAQETSNSSYLERVKSFNFSLYKFNQSDPLHTETEETEHPQDHHAEEPSQGLDHHTEEPSQGLDHHAEEPSQGLDHHVARSKSGSCVETPAKVPVKMKKSASEKMVVASVEEEEEDDIDRRRPATTRESKGRVGETFGEGEGVDEKADDFINMFKQQLKLQRLDSLTRYKEMLSRGCSK